MSIGTLQPTVFDHTSVGLTLAFLIALLVSGWALWFVWKATH